MDTDFNVKEAEISRAGEIFLATMYVIGSIIMITILAIQFKNTYRDLCGTKEARKVIFGNNPDLPVINPWYMAVMWYTVFSMVGFTVFLIASAIAVIRIEFCFYETISLFVSWVFGKVSMYCVFILRLQLLYGDTKYAWNTNYILISVGIIHAVGITTINTFWANSDDIIWYESMSENAPRYCLGVLPFINLYVVGQEVLLILCLGVAFYIPIKALMDDKPKEERDEKTSVKINKLKAYAVRTTVLYLAASGTTITFVLIIFFTNTMWIGFLDSLVSVIALGLMTSYYNRARLYEYCCCLCIKIWDPENKGKDGGLGDKQHEYTIPSASSFNEIAKQMENNLFDNNSKPEEEKEKEKEEEEMKQIDNNEENNDENKTQDPENEENA